MNPSKLLTLLLSGLLVAQPPGQSQVVVHDPISAQIAVQNHFEEILKLVAIIEQLKTTKDWLGNAGEILDLAGLDEVIANLQSEGVGLSRVEIATAATSFDGTTYEGDGLYTPVGETYLSRSGQFITRPDVFKPEAAIFNAVKNYDAVYEDAQTRRAEIRSALGKTLTQAQAATTHAEILKTTGVLIAQQTELKAIDDDLAMAGQKAMLLDLQNRADKERQESAQNQEQAVEFSEALRLFSGALSLPSFTQGPRASASGGSGRPPISRITP